MGKTHTFSVENVTDHTNANKTLMTWKHSRFLVEDIFLMFCLFLWVSLYLPISFLFKHNFLIHHKPPPYQAWYPVVESLLTWVWANSFIVYLLSLTIMVCLVNMFRKDMDISVCASVYLWECSSVGSRENPYEQVLHMSLYTWV